MSLSIDIQHLDFMPQRHSALAHGKYVANLFHEVMRTQMKCHNPRPPFHGIEGYNTHRCPNPPTPFHIIMRVNIQRFANLWTTFHGIMQMKTHRDASILQPYFREACELANTDTRILHELCFMKSCQLTQTDSSKPQPLYLMESSGSTYTKDTSY